MIRFGWMSILLLLGTVHGLITTGLLLFVKQSRTANRFLAALLFDFVLRIVPYILGYAGYYDRDPWLSFAPFDITFAFGPLVYLYVRALTSASLPGMWYILLLPAAIQAAYYAVIFAQPLTFKNYWDTKVQVPWINPAETLTALALLTGFWIVSVRQYRAYQHWLSQNVSDREDFRLSWIRNFLIALGATLLVWAGFEVTEAFFKPLNYFQRFPLFFWQTLLVYYLATEGWQNASRQYPQISAAKTSPSPEADLAEPKQRERDWQAFGSEWREAVIAGELWRDPAIDLAGLSRLLGTNTSHLSRALNEGLGQNFNEFINRQRVAAVTACLSNPSDHRDLLEIALSAGFSSKASFNRSFKLYVGLTPTEFRKNPDRYRLES